MSKHDNIYTRDENLLIQSLAQRDIEIERLRAALADQVRREETARCVRCGCTAFICGTEIAAQPEETTEACALSVARTRKLRIFK